MKASIIVFPGSNCDRDVAVAIEVTTGTKPEMVWHQSKKLPKCDIIIIPGGFSYGDHLRAGAIAAHSHIMNEIIKYANLGYPVLGICNGFQILTETGLLPGSLIRNKNLKFICKYTYLRIENISNLYTNNFNNYDIVSLPIAHSEGNFQCNKETLSKIENNGLVIFKYSDKCGKINHTSNPNGSLNNIAGLTNLKRNILGMMPHPERAIDDNLGGTDGTVFFKSILDSLS